MHRFLQRILKKSGLDDRSAPDDFTWHAFLQKVSAIIEDYEEDRYLLERALEISSAEMEALLASSKESFRQRMEALLRVIPDLIFYIDEEGRYLDVLSHGKEKLLYVPKEQVIGKTIWELFPEEYAHIFDTAHKQALEENRLVTVEYAMDIDGEKEYFEARIVPTYQKEAGKRTMFGIVRKTTSEVRAMEYLKVIRKIFKEATEGIMIAPLDGSKPEMNEAFYRMIGKERDKLERFTMKEFYSMFPKNIGKNIENAIRSIGNFQGEVIIKRERDGDLLTWLTIDSIYNENKDAIYYVAMLTDISEIQKSRDSLRYHATHDKLTGLANRTLLFETLDRILPRTIRQKEIGALFFIDLDNFKEINDNFGHKIGDLVLSESAARIESVIRETDLFGRLGGDEFLLIVEDIQNSDHAMHIAQKIIEAIRKPFEIDDLEFEIGASVGIALFPEDGKNRDEIVQHADMAMYRAKEEGKNRFEFFSKKLDLKSKIHFQIERMLKDALKHNGFRLLYQPQIELETGRVCGVEALLRLKEEVGEISLPSHFIPVAEESNIIHDISRWVFEECCRQMGIWQRQHGISDLMMAINLSRRQLLDETWIDFVVEKLDEYEIEPSRIEFEITETTMMKTKKGGYKMLKKLQALGCKLAIDDFGTGYSSLANLKHFSLDKLKIDKSFIDDILTNESDLAIVRASVALAHALGLTTIAEGVETAEQKALIQTLGCHEVQGYFFAKPMDPADLLEWIRK